MFALAFNFYSQTNLGFSEVLDKSFSVSIGFFGGAATLTAAYIASKLFNDWKLEKKYELENSLLSNILSELKPIYIELHKIRSDSNNLKKIDSYFIMKTTYLTRGRVDLFESIIGIFPSIKAYCEIKKDQKLTDLYHNYEKHLFCIDDFHRILFLEKYRRYYEAANQTDISLKPLEHYDIFRLYSESRKNNLLIEIAEILSMFKKNRLVASLGGVNTEITYDDFIDVVVGLHVEIQDYCIDKLKLDI